MALIFLFSLSIFSQDLTNVTFSVNTENIQVGANGIYLGGGIFSTATAHALDDSDGDGIWEVTVQLEPGTTGNYIFLNSPDDAGDWGATENLNGQDCADPANYDDRILEPVGTEDYTLLHCFNDCSGNGTGECSAPGTTYDVTFSVNMSNYVGGLGENDTVYLNGNFNGWCGDCNPMSDEDGDGIWSTTIPMENGDYEYKFTVNEWDDQEFWTSGDGETACAENTDDGQYENRAMTVAGEDITMLTVFWNLCVGEVPGDTYTVTFIVNTSAIVGGVGADGIFAGGGILGNAQAVQLSDGNGDGIYEGSIDLPGGTSGNYIFLNSPSDGGDWGAKENLEGQDCADPVNYNDRILPEITADTTILACFGYCSGDGTGECPDDIVTYNVTFSVNTTNITVGENGMFAGGGVLGGSNALQLYDDDGDDVWEATIPLLEGTEGNYAYFNSPTSSSDWGTKEVLEGQECADPGNYYDRILAPVTQDTVLLACFGFCSGDGTGICPEGDPAMILQGIIDFTVPEGQSNGKAIHLYVNDDIEDLSQYGLGSANNGSGTDGEEWSFPAGSSAISGQHILIARSQEAMDNYMNATEIFDQLFIDEGGSAIQQNGDDAIELFFLGGVVETFGDANDSSATPNYMDAWAYKINGEWTFAAQNCTDGSTTSCESNCPYPFADCNTNDSVIELLMSGNWRSQAEAIGHMGVGAGNGFSPSYWEAPAWHKYFSGLYDDGWTFTESTMTHDTGPDGAIFGKKPAIDAAFDPTGANAYEADIDPYDGNNNNNEYHNYQLDDYTDNYSVDLSGDYPAVVFETVGNIGFYTSSGGATFQILEASEGYVYFRNIGEDGLSWYNMMTTADYLSTNNNEILDMRIYPNPVDSNYITILSPVEGLKEIQVYTVTGRKLMDTVINGNTLDVSSFNTGFYMMKVTINGQTKVSKLVVR